MKAYRFEDVKYVCTVIEYIVRIRFIHRKDVIKLLGKDNLRNLYDGAEVWHCHTYQATASIFAEKAGIPYGIYDFVQRSTGKPLNPRQIGKVWANLAKYISDENKKDILDVVYEIFSNNNLEQVLENSNQIQLLENQSYLIDIYKNEELPISNLG